MLSEERKPREIQPYDSDCKGGGRPVSAILTPPEWSPAFDQRLQAEKTVEGGSCTHSAAPGCRGPNGGAPPEFYGAVDGGPYSLTPPYRFETAFFSFCDCNKSTLQTSILDPLYAFMGVTAVVFLSLVSMETTI